MARWWAFVLALCSGVAQADDAPSAARGRQVFEGAAAVSARIAGQDFALPTEASRCVNCHGAARVGAASSPADAQRIGPPLTRSALTQPAGRRGGPPSRYDAASLCRLLRTGVDPAHVMILRAMPRYEIGDTDCQSLWLHLMALPNR
jgi:mono/diheme cytochrome c family protein